jgi:hypothetical protein
MTDNWIIKSDRIVRSNDRIVAQTNLCLNCIYGTIKITESNTDFLDHSDVMRSKCIDLCCQLDYCPYRIPQELPTWEDIP